MGRTGRSRGSLGYALEVMSLKGGQPSPGSVSSTPAHLDASSALVLIYFFSFCSLSSFLDCEQRERWFRDQIFSSVLVGKLVMLVAILTHMKETYKWCQARERKKKKTWSLCCCFLGWERWSEDEWDRNTFTWITLVTVSLYLLGIMGRLPMKMYPSRLQTAGLG